MKRLFIITLFILCFSEIDAQTSKLSELASGRLQVFSAIREFDDEVFGYWALYKLDELNDSEDRYEYVILDKNLNKVANGEFTDVRYPKTFSRYYPPQKVGDELIFTKRYSDGRTFSNLLPLYTLHRKINVKTNKVSTTFYAKDGQLIDGAREIKKSLFKDLKNNKSIEFPVAYKNGFFMYQLGRTPNQTNNKFKDLNYYALNKEMKWSFAYNKNERDLDYFFDVMDEDNLILTVIEQKENLRKIQKINPENGELLFSYYLENKESEYNHVFDVEQIENKTIIIGKISPFNAEKGYNYKRAVGLFKVELNEKGEEVSKKYFKWEDASAFIDINEKGKLEGGYRLLAKSYFVFKDGSITVLMEKYKESLALAAVSGSIKTEDFVLMNFDKDFNLSDVYILDKEKSKNLATDYLYSQYINGKEGVVFFYKDLKKDDESLKKNWVLGIVSIINGKINHETIPMSSKKHFISPYIAKEGYILLREFNENEEYNQIRLERLNY